MPAPTLSPEALAELQAYDYPGNIRELKNLLERALIESGGGRDPGGTSALRLCSAA